MMKFQEERKMERKRNRENLKHLVMAALFSSMVYVMTALVKIPTHQGYIHIGDGVIYLAASLLPMPYAMMTGAVGAGLADYLSGYPMWVIPTMIIKALSAAMFTSSKPRIINRHNIIALFLAAAICVGGYYFAAVLLYGDWGAALVDIPTNLIQSAASAVLYIFVAVSLDKSPVRR